MMIFFAFLVGFYFGVCAISLLVVAGRKQDKKEIHMAEQPQMRQAAPF
jgi:hypothetical protein